MDIKIEKNIPLKYLQHGYVTLARKMEIGDSILFENNKASNSFITNCGRVTGFKFSKRRQPDGKSRVWSVE